MKKPFLFLAVILLSASSGAYAALIDRGGGLVYDTDLNITWLQDANFAKTSGYDSDGLMTWDQAMTWADSLVYFDALRSVSYDNWRLPTSDTCKGFSCTDSEMGHLFYYEFSGFAGLAAHDSGDPDLGLFVNLQRNSYWSGSDTTEKGSCTTCDYAYKFMMHSGSQDIEDTPSHLYALAVRDGDVTPVPEPSTFLLLGAGLISVIPLRRIIRAC